MSIGESLKDLFKNPEPKDTKGEIPTSENLPVPRSALIKRRDELMARIDDLEKIDPNRRPTYPMSLGDYLSQLEIVNSELEIENNEEDKQL